MIIELQEPFKSKWSKGYLVVNPENRRNVILFNSDSDRTTVSYARYLMGIKLGYEVPDHLEVDHIDNDKTNDDINNLQLLTPEQNRLKQEYHFTMNQVNLGFHCAYCDTPFILPEREVKERIRTGGELAFCSRKCGSLYHVYVSGRTSVGKLSLSEDQIQKIKLLKSEGLSNRKISQLTGVPRSTVGDYIKRF